MASSPMSALLCLRNTSASSHRMNGHGMPKSHKGGSNSLPQLRACPHTSKACPLPPGERVRSRTAPIMFREEGFYFRKNEKILFRLRNAHFHAVPYVLFYELKRGIDVLVWKESADHAA